MKTTTDRKLSMSFRRDAGAGHRFSHLGARAAGEPLAGPGHVFAEIDKQVEWGGPKSASSGGSDALSTHPRDSLYLLFSVTRRSGAVLNAQQKLII